MARAADWLLTLNEGNPHYLQTVSKPTSSYCPVCTYTSYEITTNCKICSSAVALQNCPQDIPDYIFCFGHKFWLRPEADENDAVLEDSFEELIAACESNNDDSTATRTKITDVDENCLKVYRSSTIQSAVEVKMPVKQSLNRFDEKENQMQGKAEVIFDNQSVDDTFDETDEYEVECIHGDRKRQGKVEFLIRWKGFDSSHDTWLGGLNILLLFDFHFIRL